MNTYRLGSACPRGHARLIGIMKKETGGLSWIWFFVIWFGLFILISH
jgi:hypothetical protein